jgi:hypothetical protein
MRYRWSRKLPKDEDVERRAWMATVIAQLPGLLIDDLGHVDSPWAWKALPEVEAALERAYERGDRGDALVAAWRQADLSPALIAEVDADVARTAAAKAEKLAKIKAACEARAALAKTCSERPPGESIGASPRGGASAPQKETSVEKTQVKEQCRPLEGEPAGNPSSQAKPASKPNHKSTMARATSAASQLLKKFGAIIMSDGFTAIPNVLLKNQKELKLSHLDMLLVVHLLSFWWKAEGFIWPSKETLAARVNVAECTVRRRIARMEDLGLIKRVARKGEEGGSKSNVYDLSGLLAKLEELAMKADA